MKHGPALTMSYLHFLREELSCSNQAHIIALNARYVVDSSYTM